MKILLVLVIALLSPLAQAACKCNCNPMDKSLCASNYDLANPCIGLCPAATPGLGLMLTACPGFMVANPLTGIKRWETVCPADLPK